MQSFRQDVMDCPNCGKRGLVRQTNDIYQCLCCSFKRNLSEPSFGEAIFWTISTLILATLIFANLRPQEPSNNSQPQVQSLSCLPETLVTR
jgi:hypothetical protein